MHRTSTGAPVFVVVDNLTRDLPNFCIQNCRNWYRIVRRRTYLSKGHALISRIGLHRAHCDVERPEIVVIPPKQRPKTNSDLITRTLDMAMDNKVGAALEADTEAEIMMCVNCGIAEGDDIKLEECVGCFHHHHAGCQSVRYCCDKCREEYRKEHEEECRNWKGWLHDRKLFHQPDETNLGDCPICFLPLPLDYTKWRVNSCCCKMICKGCHFANRMRENEQGLEQRCAYCREPLPDTQEEIEQNKMKRARANDPAGLFDMGSKHYKEGDYGAAFEYWTKAAALGDANAHHNLSVMYYNGEGVEKDEKKQVYHLEEAAIAGHPRARHCLGVVEEVNGHIEIERAAKHYIIAANLGDEMSMNAVTKHFCFGDITEETLEATRRTHQAALDEMKSSQRERKQKRFTISSLNLAIYLDSALPKDPLINFGDLKTKILMTSINMMVSHYG